MPIPKPRKGEKEKDFIQRCMGDDIMVSEYPDQSQRRAVCQSQINDNMKILVYGNIGEKIDGDAISQQLRDASQQTDTIDVHINSYGGDVQQGVSIFSTILSLNSEGKIVNTYVDGFAASIASIIAIAGKSIYMNDFARIMVHEAFMGDNSNLSENDQKALNEINDMLAQILSRRGVNKNSIAAKMREETWIRSKDAKELGLVDKIIETKAALKQRAEVIMSSQEMDNMKQLNYMNNLLGELAVTPQTAKTQNVEKMERLKAKLDVTSEDKAIARFDDLNNKVETLQNEKSELEKENKALKDEKAEQVKNELISLIDKAIEKGQLSKEKRDELIKQGVEAPEAVKSLLNSVPEPKQAPDNSLSAQWMNAQNQGDGDTKEKLSKEYERMMSEEPEALSQLENTNPERFKQLFNAWNEV